MCSSGENDSNLGKMTQTTENNKGLPFFITLNTPFCKLCSSNKIKTIKHKTLCDTITNLCSSNINHSQPVLKHGEK